MALISQGAGGGRTTTTSVPRSTASARVTLVTQMSYVNSGEHFILCVRVRGVADPSQAELVVSTYERLVTRTDFRRTLEGTLRLNVDTDVIPLTEPALPCGADSFYVLVPPPRSGSEGVYPVKVELRDTADPRVLNSFVTHLIYVPTVPVAKPVNAAIVLPVHDAPALQPGGARHLAHLDALAALAAALQTVPDVPLVLDPTPETLDALAAAGDDGQAAVATLRDSLRSRQVLEGPYVPVDLPSLLDAQLGDEADAQFTAGSDVVARRLLTGDQRPDARTWVVRDPIDAEALANLRGRGFDRLVVPDENLSEQPNDLPLEERARPFSVQGRPGSEQEAFVADANLASHFAGGDQVLRAHHLLAEMSFVYFERPGEEDPRGLVAVAPREWRPTRAFLQALLQGLQGNPLITAMTLDALFNAVPPARDGRTPLERELVASPDGTAYSAGALRSTRSQLNGFATVVEPGNDLPDRLSDRLLVSQSIDLPAARRSSYLGAVDVAIREQVDLIKLPTGRTITLTAREGEIPISFRNETGYPVRVKVRVESDKLVVQDNERDLDLVRLNTTERFSVQARTSGDSALTIVLESPDRSLPINRTLLTVRSTAASGVGVVLSAGAALFLVVWWGRDIRRRRRNRRLSEAPASGG